LSDAKVTRSDIEDKFRELQTEMTVAADSAKGKVTTAAVAGAVLLLLVVYLFGRKAGKRRSTVVEIRRL
jgi:hypothetical protein